MCDIGKFFPVRTMDQIKSFLDEDKLSEKKMGLERLIYTLVYPGMTQSQFENALLYGLFDRGFISQHKWPTLGYVNSIFFIYSMTIYVYLSFYWRNKPS